MKLDKDLLIQGMQLVRHLKGEQAMDELDLAKLTVHASHAVARSLLVGRQRKAADGEGNAEEDDFLSALEGGWGGPDDDAAFDFLSAFGGEGDSLGFEGPGDNNESAWFDLSAMMGAGEEDSGNSFADLFSSLMLGGLGGAGEEQDDGFAILGDVMQNVEACGIDLADMATKVLEAFIMGDTGTDTIDYSDPQSYEVFYTVLMALKDDDEPVCSETETARLPIASKKFMQCAGLSDFCSEDETETATLMQTILDSCKSTMNTVIAGAGGLTSLDYLIDESNDFDSLDKSCFQNLYGDNPIGNTIRYEYHHLDKVGDCFGKLGEDLPHCVISSPSPLNDSRTHSVPLSIMKKLACVLGSSYTPALDMLCVSTYEGLDECLPQLDEDVVNGVTSMCAIERGLNLGKMGFGMDSSVISGNKMPAFCSKIFEEKGIDTLEVQSRLDHYNKNREYGWTLDSIGHNEAHVEVEEVEEARASLESSSKEHSTQKYSKSWLVEIPGVDDKASSPTSPSAVDISMRTLLLVVFGVIALALVIKQAKSRRRSVPFCRASRPAVSNVSTSRQNYAHVAMETEDNEIL